MAGRLRADDALAIGEDLLAIGGTCALFESTRR
jgi:hypothetical protein